MMHDSTNTVKTMYQNISNVICTKNLSSNGFCAPSIGESVAYFSTSNVTTSEIPLNLSNCTIEYIFYQNQASNTTFTLGPVQLSIDDYQQLVFRNGSSYLDSYAGIDIQKWHHVAVSTDGSDLKMYIDGVQLLNPIPPISYFGLPTTDGSYPLTLAGKNMYYSEIKISNTCLYTDSYISPTFPLTQDPSTCFLLRHNISSSYFSNLESNLYSRGWYYMNAYSTFSLSSNGNGLFVVGTTDGTSPQISKSPLTLGSNLYYPIQILNSLNTIINGTQSDFIQSIDFPVNYKIQSGGVTLKFSTFPNFDQGYDMIFQSISRPNSQFYIQELSSLLYLIPGFSMSSVPYSWSATSPSPGLYFFDTLGPYSFVDVQPSTVNNYIWFSMSTRSSNASYILNSTTYQPSTTVDVYLSNVRLTPPDISSYGTVGSLPIINGLTSNTYYSTYLNVPGDSSYTYVPVSFTTKTFGSFGSNIVSSNSSSATFSFNYLGYPSTKTIQISNSGSLLSTSTIPTLSKDSGTLASPPIIYNLNPTTSYTFSVFTPLDSLYDSWANTFSATTKSFGTASISSVTIVPNSNQANFTMSYSGFPATQLINVYLQSNLLGTSTLPTLSKNGNVFSPPTISNLGSGITYSLFANVLGDSNYDAYTTNTITFTSLKFGTVSTPSIVPGITTATVSWTYTSYPSLQSMNVNYTTDNITWSNAITTVGSSPYVLTGLTSNTNYNVKLVVPTDSNTIGYTTSNTSTTTVVPSATGTGGIKTGPVGISGINYYIHAFTASNTFTLTGSNTSCDVLVVGGGGGCSGYQGGGAGAGGIVFRPGYQVNTGTYTATVGNGGVGVGGGAGNNGNNSVFNTITALGGGYGIGVNGSVAGIAGGSGGGACVGSGQTNNALGGTGLQPSQTGDSGGVYGFGNAGGANTNGANPGGGGGAGAVGQDRSAGGGGGVGVCQVTVNGTLYNFANIFNTNIYGQVSGSNIYFAGGGAGGYGAGQALGGGGTGGGDFSAGSAGQANTGGGAGGAGNGFSGTNASGGSGIIILRYPTTDLYLFSTFTFTNAGATGANGPILSQLQNSYSATAWTQSTSYLNMTTQGIQLWTVPSSGTYTITCAGAAGGAGNGGPGTGAIITSNIALNAGSILKIAIGQVGVTGPSPCGIASGGGGGTFVTDNSNNPIMVAGGGGGGGVSGVRNASLTTSGTTDGGNNGTGGTNGSGGTNGTQGCQTNAGSGGGLTGNGIDSAGLTSINGLSFVNGAVGGSGGGVGGFGGGGATSATGYMGGGGGGYSGGAGGIVGLCTCPNCFAGGGGGSYYTGTLQSNSVTNTGMGYVTVTKI